MIWLNISICLATFFFMECVAWFTHKYIMHGFMWKVHKDHHVRNPNAIFELNDLFFLIFATPGSIFIIYGSQLGFNYPMFWIGLGITIYGAAYFFVHDLFIHQRIKVLRRTKNPYLMGIRRGHKTHHKHLGKEKGECFGMLLVPLKYFRFSNKK